MKENDLNFANAQIVEEALEAQRAKAIESLKAKLIDVVERIDDFEELRLFITIYQCVVKIKYS